MLGGCRRRRPHHRHGRGETLLPARRLPLSRDPRPPPCMELGAPLTWASLPGRWARNSRFSGASLADFVPPHPGVLRARLLTLSPTFSCFISSSLLPCSPRVPGARLVCPVPFHHPTPGTPTSFLESPGLPSRSVFCPAALALSSRCPHLLLRPRRPPQPPFSPTSPPRCHPRRRPFPKNLPPPWHSPPFGNVFGAVLFPPPFSDLCCRTVQISPNSTLGKDRIKDENASSRA